jgi:hypothetical protein
MQSRVFDPARPSKACLGFLTCWMPPSQKTISTTENLFIITLESELKVTGPDHESQSADSAEQNQGEVQATEAVGCVARSVPDRPYSSASTRCTREMEIDPSPTAAATRFTFPARTSPTANTPGRLVSSICGTR